MPMKYASNGLSYKTSLHILGEVKKIIQCSRLGPYFRVEHDAIHVFLKDNKGDIACIGISGNRIKLCGAFDAFRSACLLQGFLYLSL